MDYEWDPKKAASNWSIHRVSFKAARRFLWDFALEFRDERKDYPEVRTIAIGLIDVNGSRFFICAAGISIRLSWSARGGRNSVRSNARALRFATRSVA